MNRFAMALLLGWAFVAPLAAQTCNSKMPESTPASRFTVHGDGTVSDQQTGLMWKQCAEGQSGAGCTGTAATYTWQAALDLAAASGFAGYTDWRLPNIKELSSIVERKCYDPAINLGIFPNTPSGWFWSSSAHAYYSSYALIVYFSYGYDDISNRNNNNSVRLVRGVK